MRCNETNYIKRFKKGKEDSLEFIIDKYLSLIKGITYKVLSPLKNDGCVEECINDIFLSIWENRDKFEGNDVEFKKWIAVISKFKAIDYYRKELRNQEIVSNDIDLSHRNLVEDEIINTENMNELISLINLLGAVDKDIFIMKFFLGMSSDDIAKKMSVTKASIDNKIYRGKKKLKKYRVGVF